MFNGLRLSGKTKTRVGLCIVIGISLGVFGLTSQKINADDCTAVWQDDGPRTEPSVAWPCNAEGEAVETITNGSYNQKKQSPCESVPEDTRSCTLTLVRTGTRVDNEGTDTEKTMAIYQMSDSCGTGETKEFEIGCCDSPIGVDATPTPDPNAPGSDEE